jgi:polyisoprenoid-binding protein YceI
MKVKVRRTGAGKDPWGGYRVGFATAFTLKRSDFGMRHALGTVGDEVKVTVNIESVRQ